MTKSPTQNFITETTSGLQLLSLEEMNKNVLDNLSAVLSQPLNADPTSNVSIMVNQHNLDLVATAGNGEDYNVSLESLVQEVEKQLLQPLLLDRMGKIIINYDQREMPQTYSDGYFKYILCDGTLGYRLDDYPYNKLMF
ncbi:MAG: hypothetical protein FWE18_04425 [Alphaproteobacteria bacterium]|nr:hypothetical protein [Alphaproteobacteria bacterium]